MCKWPPALPTKHCILGTSNLVLWSLLVSALGILADHTRPEPTVRTLGNLPTWQWWRKCRGSGHRRINCAATGGTAISASSQIPRTVYHQPWPSPFEEVLHYHNSRTTDNWRLLLRPHAFSSFGSRPWRFCLKTEKKDCWCRPLQTKKGVTHLPSTKKRCKI